MTSPDSGDQPAYVDPITGQQLFVDPVTGQLTYPDAAASPYPAMPPTTPYPGPAGYAYAPPFPPGPYQPGPYQPGPYQPGPYQSGPYQSGPYQAGPYQPGADLALPGSMPAGYPMAGGYPMADGYAMPNPYLYPPVNRPSNGLATAAMVLSIVGAALLFCDGIGVVPALVGAILGHVARRQIRQRDEGGAGMALAGIIIGWIVVGIVAIGITILILFAVHNPEDFG